MTYGVLCVFVCVFVVCVCAVCLCFFCVMLCGVFFFCVMCGFGCCVLLLIEYV